MNFKRRTKVIRNVDNQIEQYPHVLSMYKIPPLGDISLLEFENLAYERVQVLQILEFVTQIEYRIFSNEWKKDVYNHLRKRKLRKYIRLIESTGCSATDAGFHLRREDCISHFILRQAFCRTSELRYWFISREVELFKMRFLNLTSEGKEQFMVENKLNFIPISVEEKEEIIKTGLLQSTVDYSPDEIKNTNFYKVPFSEVFDLVRKRSVFISKGFAFIPTNHLISCIVTQFREHLRRSMICLNERSPSKNDERLKDLLENLLVIPMRNEYSKVDVNSDINTANLCLFVSKSFPLCMRHIYDVIKTTHHMKHFGRLQFGLFLKGIGLSLEEAIDYWKTEFCKLIDEETFDKKYLYYIRHSYGAIGGMKNYTPYGCWKIITSEPGPRDHHGCPYKLWDKDVLQEAALEYGLTPDATQEIVEIASKGHCQIACSKYFEYIHNGIKPMKRIRHPNQYFYESIDALAQQKK